MEIRRKNMKNKSLSIFIATLILLSFVSLAQASKNDNALNKKTNGIVPAQPSVQVQKQIKTQNQGEDSQLMIENKEEINGHEDETTAKPSSESSVISAKKESPRSEIAKERMSNVAAQVEMLLSNKTMKGGIGEQVREIAQAQKQAQEQVKAKLDQVESRRGLLKSLFGPDFKALKNMEDQLEANQLRIEKLTELKTELTNQSDIDMIEATIQALTEQNTQLQETVVDESQSKSMLGWLFRYFIK